MNKTDYQGTEIAIIGISGRFPKADSVDELWQNLKNGKECIQFFSEKELLESGVEPTTLKNNNYVKAKAQINNIDMFDSAFFGFTPKEAEITDPQHRLFLEHSWQALENAGYDISNYEGLIGVFAGQGINNYFINHINNNESSVLNPIEASINNIGDTLCTRVSYKLNLKGPSLTVQTACSTSLVSVHMGCQSLLLNECDMAIAGGVKVISPRNHGYLYSKGGITSPDGHCRAFDSKSAGMVPGEGIGIVVLKRLEDAFEDGDHIYSIIRGSAINNDGSLKIGFTAPSIEGQSNAISDAISLSGIEPQSVNYIETHGTGTNLGDPVEIEALRTAFGSETKNQTAIGSVKTNLGHLDSAAGVTGLIKTVLMLNHKKLVPSLHFETPNPKCRFENKQFFVNTEYKDWERNGLPRRAGVSSFGIGGTNAHVILEEAPEVEKSNIGRKYKMLFLSAKSEQALDNATKNLEKHLKENSPISLNDTAYTLQVGRKSFSYRRALVVNNINDALDKLGSIKEYKSNIYDGTKKKIIFMFSGQGSQYVGMAQGLYKSEPYFYMEVEKCLNILSNYSTINLKEIILGELDPNLLKEKINDTRITQPLLFIIEYSLAKLLTHWGVNPDMMIGHSIGEYVAACISGVFNENDAIKIVAKRGELMQSMPTGKMLSVPINPDEIKKIISNDLDIAAYNTSNSCVVSGEYQSIEDTKKTFQKNGVHFVELKTSHAFHSSMMEPILSEFERTFDKVQLHPPTTPFISNVSGTWISNEEAISPSYWSKHLRNTVQFEKGISVLLQQERSIFIEMGPGRTLCSFVNQHTAKKEIHEVVNLLRHPKESKNDNFMLMEQICHLWMHGVKINWNNFYEEEKRQRIPLPTYPFERQRHWITPPKKEQKAEKCISSKDKSMSNWFHIPVWEQSPINTAEPKFNNKLMWLIFSNNDQLSDIFVNDLYKNQQNVIKITIGEEYHKASNKEFFINPSDEKHYLKLFQDIKDNKEECLIKIVHFWNAFKSKMIELKYNKNRIDYLQDIGLFSFTNLAKATGISGFNSKLEIYAITNSLHSVTGMEKINPICATLIGAIKTIPLEYSNISCVNIDIQRTEDSINSYLSKQILSEVFHDDGSRKVIAYRGRYRWEQRFKQSRLKRNDSEPGFRKNGVYLITGGFGGMGSTFAKFLAENYNAKLVLIGRTQIPIKSEWDNYILENPKDNKIASIISKLKEFESNGKEVSYFSSNISNFKDVKKIIETSKKKYGAIHGVLHTAGLADYEGIILNRKRNQTAKILEPKVIGTITLHSLLKKEPLDFFICFSSLANQLYPANFGQIGYNAANEFLDSYTHYANKPYIKTVNWNGWKQVGMKIQAINKQGKNINDENLTENSLTPEEGIEVLLHIVQNSYNQIAISKEEIGVLFKKIKEKNLKKTSNISLANKQELNDYEASPELGTRIQENSEIEKAIEKVFKKFLGYKKIKGTENFFSLGVNSLLIINILPHLKKEIGVQVSAHDIYNYPTIKKLSDFILSNANKSSSIQLTTAPKASDYLVIDQQIDEWILYKFYNNTLSIGNIVQKEEILNLNYEAFEAAVKIWMERYELLRTIYIQKGKTIRQKILNYNETGFKVEYINDKVWSEKTKEYETHEKFNLEKGPILRIKVLREVKGLSTIIFVFSHMITDGIRQKSLLNELKEIYNNKCKGNNPNLPEIKFQFKDFCYSLDKYLKNVNSKKHLEYWRKKLNGNLPSLTFSTPGQFELIKKKREETYKYIETNLNNIGLNIDTSLLYILPRFNLEEGNMLTRLYKKEKFEKLIQISIDNKTNLFTVISAIFYIWTHHYTKKNDIIIAFPETLRKTVESSNILGWLSSGVIIPETVSPKLKFNEFVKIIEKDFKEASEHCFYSMQRVFKELNISDNFNIPFHLNYFTAKSSVADFDIQEQLNKHTPTRKTKIWELNVTMFKCTDGLLMFIRYKTSLFTKDEIEKMFDFLDKITNSISQNRNISIEELFKT